MRDLQTGELLPDAIGGVLEPVVWAADNRTIFYIRQDPVTLQSGPVFRHALGTAAGADVKVYEERDKTQFVSIGRSASGRFVVIHIGGHDTAETRAVPTDRPTARPRVVLARKPGVRHDADHLDGRWVVRTNERARNFRLVEAPAALQRRAVDDVGVGQRVRDLARGLDRGLGLVEAPLQEQAHRQPAARRRTVGVVLEHGAELRLGVLGAAEAEVGVAEQERQVDGVAVAGGQRLLGGGDRLVELVLFEQRLDALHGGVAAGLAVAVGGHDAQRFEIHRP